MSRSVWAALLLPLAVSFAAWGDKPDRVEAARKALRRPAHHATPDVQKAHLGWLRGTLTDVSSPADLCRVLLLPEWGTGNEGGRDPQAVFARGLTEARGWFAERAAAALRAELKKPSLGRERAVALLTLIGRTVTHERQRGGVAVGSGFAGLVDDVYKWHEAQKSPALRRAALRELGRMLSDPRSLAAALGRALTSADGAEKRDAAEVLLEASRPPDRPTRIEPIEEVLRRVGDLAPAAGQFARDADEGIRLRGLEALALFSKAIHFELRCVYYDPDDVPPRETDPEGWKQFELTAFEAMRQTRPALAPLDAALQAAVTALADKDLAACLAGHKALESAATARHILRELATALGKGAPNLSRELNAPVRGLPALARSLSHKEMRVRLAAIYALETLADDAAPAAEALAKALADDSAFARWGAARALRNMAPAGADKSVAALAKALADDSADVRHTAAVALGRCGPKARAAAEALGRATRHEDDGLRSHAAEALGRVGAGEAALAAALADAKPAVRAAAARALAKVGALAAPSRAALAKALDDSDEEVKLAAAATLLGAE